MRNVIVHDRRLRGSPPEGNCTVISVDAETPLETMIREVVSCSNRYGTEIKLAIYAHGITRDGRGGFGLQVCREGNLLDRSGHLETLFLPRSAPAGSLREPAISLRTPHHS